METRDPRGASSDGDTARKNRIRELEARLGAAQEKLERARERRAALTERLHRYERATLDALVLAHLLPARARAFRQRPRTDAAGLREREHLQRSVSYRETIERGDPADGAESVTIDGLTFWIPQDHRLPGRLSDDLLSKGSLPLRTILRTREAVGGGIMLDIGANVGTTSLPRAVLGDYETIYGAEPEPGNFACLVRSVVDNGLRGVVLPDRCAISDRNGRIALRRSKSIGGHRLADVAPNGVEVETSTLESWIARLGVDVEAIRFIKVDTQGRESHVLAGGESLARRSGIVWQIEFSPRHLRRAGREPAEVITQLQALFSYFIDLYQDAPGSRVRPIHELAEGLSYLGESFTDLLLYRVD